MREREIMTKGDNDGREKMQNSEKQYGKITRKEKYHRKRNRVTPEQVMRSYNSSDQPKRYYCLAEKILTVQYKYDFFIKIELWGKIQRDIRFPKENDQSWVKIFR